MDGLERGCVAPLIRHGGHTTAGLNSLKISQKKKKPYEIWKVHSLAFLCIWEKRIPRTLGEASSKPRTASWWYLEREAGYAGERTSRSQIDGVGELDSDLMVPGI